MMIAVVDGQGGGIGRAIVEKLRAAGLAEAEIMALGTNSVATGQMLRAGASEGATGENAIVVNVEHADIIVGVIAVLATDSMRGELSPAMAMAIGKSRAKKILLPINRCGIYVAGLDEKSLGEYIDAAVEKVREIVNGN